MTAMFLCGDCRDILPTLAACSVHCVVTSPPYFGLRDYGTARWDGGDGDCSHVAAATGSTQNKGNNGRNGAPFRDTCGKCGARRVDSQIGLEADPAEYIAAMVGVFREVRRVLRDDGTLWLNMGDSYNANQGNGWMPTGGHNGHPSPKVYSGLAPKQLLMMPARLALALQADGWWIRSDIIWAKPNPMPESVKGSTATRHMITLSEHERLSRMSSAGQRAGSVRAGDVPGLSAREVSDGQASISADGQGHSDSESAGGAAGRAGEAPVVLGVGAGLEEQGEIRGDAEGQSRPRYPGQEASSNAESQCYQRSEASADEGRSQAAGATSIGEHALQTDGQWEGPELSAARKAQGRDPSNRDDADGSAVAGDREGGQGAMLLLWGEEEADAGPCDPAVQGRPAYRDERGSCLRAVQLEEERPTGADDLVPCPGCDKCIDGYIAHLYAGRPTSAQEHIFLLTKSPSISSTPRRCGRSARAI